MLVRKVKVNGEVFLQGSWLNWPVIQGWLANEVADLLPNTKLTAATDVDSVDESRMLAALPIRLVPGALPAATAGGWGPIKFSLLIV